MAKIRKLIKIFVATIVTIFLVAVCIIGILLVILHVKASRQLSWEIFERELYEAAGCYCRPYPPSKDWIECARIKGAWKYLKNENVQKIAFCDINPDFTNLSPDNYLNCWEIVEPNRIKQMLKLIHVAKNADNHSIVWRGRIKIITDKHKLIIPVGVGDYKVYGLEWTSSELRKQLWKWGYGQQVYEYVVPPKKQTVAILLYSKHFKGFRPLGIFGDKKLAEELMYGIKSKAGEIIVGKQFAPKKTFEGRYWLEKIMEAYEIAIKEAKEREKGSYFPAPFDAFDCRIGFITRDEFYWKGIGVAENAVYDDYIESEQLKAYFDELGLVDELLAERLSKEHQN